MPKAQVKNERLISTETSFLGHKFEEENDPAYIHKNDNYGNSAINSYHYQKKMIQPINTIEEFMPVI